MELQIPEKSFENLTGVADFSKMLDSKILDSGTQGILSVL